MDPKVYGKLLTTHRRGLGDDVEALRGRFSLRRLQDGISRIQKVAEVELGFHGPPGCFRGTWVYIGGRSRSVDARGAHKGGGHAHLQGACRAPSWSPPLLLDIHSKSPGSCLFLKDRSRRFHSIWTPLDIPFLRNT